MASQQTTIRTRGFYARMKLIQPEPMEIETMAETEMGIKDESEAEEMDRDSDSDKVSGSDQETSSDSETDESSSDLDEEELDRRRNECSDTLVDLERQFNILREQLYRERFTQVDSKLFEIRSGRAPEYLQPLQELQENMRIRTEVAAVLKQFALASVQFQIEAEAQAAQQNLQSEQQLLKDAIQEGLENEIRRLEEDRNNIDVSSALWGSEQPRRGGSRRKPITVTGPYVIYMLSDADILNDLTIIKKALTASKRKSSVH